ncbi:hypothetical protein SUGI_0821840 [Cryptomeria japonica]|nr:hypothetical protein SUGI_0821840 [Cryptomeria japonica]
MREKRRPKGKRKLKTPIKAPKSAIFGDSTSTTVQTVFRGPKGCQSGVPLSVLRIFCRLKIRRPRPVAFTPLYPPADGNLGGLVGLGILQFQQRQRPFHGCQAGITPDLTPSDLSFPNFFIENGVSWTVDKDSG